MKPTSSRYIKCLGFTTDEDYGGYPCMIVEEFWDENMVPSLGTGKWFMGLGGRGGPLINSSFEAVGGVGHRLLRVFKNGKKICEFSRSNELAPHQQ